MINEQDLSDENIDELLAVRRLLEGPKTIAPNRWSVSQSAGHHYATSAPTTRLQQSQTRQQPQQPVTVKRRLIILDGRSASSTAGSPSVSTAPPLNTSTPPPNTSTPPPKRACVPVTPAKNFSSPEVQRSPITRTIGTSPNLCRALLIVQERVPEPERVASEPVVGASTREDSSDATETASPCSLPPSQEKPEPLDKYGLPLDINQRFSRWLYKDMSDFAPGSRTRKNTEDEAIPDKDNPDPDVPKPETLRPPRPPPARSVKFNDALETDLGFKFITQDIDLDEPLPMEELVTPTLKAKASSSLQATAAKNVTQTNSTISSASASSSTATTSNGQKVANVSESERQGSGSRKPKLTIILEVNKTIIDRRPMLRKLRSKPSVVSRRQTELSGDQVTSTSLIGPGEDCDDSEDDEPIVIDCDA